MNNFINNEDKMNSFDQVLSEKRANFLIETGISESEAIKRVRSLKKKIKQVILTY